MNNQKPVISLISYLNAKPLTLYFEDTISNKYSIESDIPSVSCNKLISEQVEAGLVSSIIIPENNNLNIVNNICIASEGPVESVLLIGNKSISNIKTIALDFASKTSNILLQILFTKYLNRKIEYKVEKDSIETLLNKYDAVLAIGDKAFSYGIKNPSSVILDLAMEWKHFTGLPFVFAVWGILKTSKLDPAIFQKGKEYGMGKIDKIANSYAIENNLTSFGRKLAYKYLTENLSYNLGQREQKSLILFYNLANELKLINYTNKIQFTQ